MLTKGHEGGNSQKKTYVGIGEPDGPVVAVLLGDGAGSGLVLVKNPNPSVLSPFLGLGLQLGSGNSSALHL